MIKVLLVEDSPADAAHVMEVLCEVEREDFALTYEVSVNAALERLAEESFDVVLLELHLAGSELAGGDELAGLAQLKDAAPLLPVVLLCTHAERFAAEEAIRRGAEDVVEEGDRTGEVLARSILYAKEKVNSAAQLLFLSRHDPLTGLANRAAFRERVSQALARSDRSQTPGALLLIDLDCFKSINDTRGPDVGDHLLKHVADQLRSFVRSYDVVARLGGDEFAILMEEMQEARDAGQLAERILEAVAAPFVVGDVEVFTTASIGAVIFPFDGNEPASLLRNADFALYRAKQDGGDTAAFYTESTDQRIHDQLELEHDLHRALAHDEFLLHYQPQVNWSTGQIVGMEALARWQHPERGLVPPNAFIPAAEKSGLITAIGEWALRSACRQRQEWVEAGLDVGRIAVNLSPRQLRGRQFVALTEKTLRDVGLDPHLLELEITEALFLDDDPETIESLAHLRKLGIRIAVDDFGTGYSCLSRITALPVDAVKIDRSLVRQAGSGQNTAVARAIIALSRELGLDVTCEGVETEAHATFLKQYGCDVIQGFLLSPGLPPEEIPAWVARRNHTVAPPPATSKAEGPNLLH